MSGMVDVNPSARVRFVNGNFVTSGSPTFHGTGSPGGGFGIGWTGGGRGPSRGWLRDPITQPNRTPRTPLFTPRQRQIIRFGRLGLRVARRTKLMQNVLPWPIKAALRASDVIALYERFGDTPWTITRKEGPDLNPKFWNAGTEYISVPGVSDTGWVECCDIGGPYDYYRSGTHGGGGVCGSSPLYDCNTILQPPTGPRPDVFTFAPHTWGATGGYWTWFLEFGPDSGAPAPPGTRMDYQRSFYRTLHYHTFAGPMYPSDMAWLPNRTQPVVLPDLVATSGPMIPGGNGVERPLPPYERPALHWDRRQRRPVRGTHTEMPDDSDKMKIDYGLAGNIYGGTTELADLVDSIADAIPNRPCSRGGLHERLACVFRNAGRIDWRQAVVNIGTNNLQDYLIGRFGQLGRRAVQNAVRHGYYRSPIGLTGGSSFHRGTLGVRMTNT